MKTKHKVILISAGVITVLIMLISFLRYVFGGTIGGAFTGLFTLAVIIGVIMFFDHIEKTNQKFAIQKAKYEKEEAERVAERIRKATPEYILEHNPNYRDLERILNTTKNPRIRQKALEVALNSGDINKICLVNQYAPGEFGQRPLKAYLDVQFNNATPEECQKYLREYKNWDLLPEWKTWWLDWRDKLQKRYDIHQQEVAREREEQRIKNIAFLAEQERLEVLRNAEASGKDVCWKCETINPHRCDYCKTCMNCDNDNQQYCHTCRNSTPCGDPTCGGWCYICDDDD